MDVLTSATNQLKDIKSQVTTTIESTPIKVSPQPATGKMAATVSSTTKPTWGAEPSMVVDSKELTPKMAKPRTDTTGNENDNTSQPVCQNCSTINTPLWRRDENGQILCNACGLFLKLHGKSRPISLKTDVIKSRNRVKTNQMNSNKLGSRSAGSSPALEPSSPSKANINSDGNGNIAYLRKTKPGTVGLGRFRSGIPSMSVPSGSSGSDDRAIPPDSQSQNGQNGSNFSFMFRAEDGNGKEVLSNESNSVSGLNDIPHTGPASLLLSSSSSNHSHAYSLPRPSSRASLPNFSSADMSDKPALAALSAAAHAASVESEASHAGNHGTSDMSSKSPNLNASTTVLDQLTAAAAASPYLSPHQPESDTREAPLSRHSMLNTETVPKDTQKPSSINSVSPLNSPKNVESGSGSGSPPSNDAEVESHIYTIMQLKTRVSELELVNDLLRSRVSELEVSESAARKCENAIRESETFSRKYTASLESKVLDLEKQVRKYAKLAENYSAEPRKKARLSDIL